jgi:hypothetical protein
MNCGKHINEKSREIQKITEKGIKGKGKVVPVL